MFRTAGYPVHSPHFTYDYTSPPRSPPLSPSYGYYSPRQSYYTTTSASKGYFRPQSSDEPYGYSTAYTSPRESARYSTDYSSSGYYSSAHSSPRLSPEYVPVYTSSSDSSSRSRPRRTSHIPKPSPPRRRKTTTTKPPPKATAEDARRAGIPAGYSYKNWDPTEEPILLLGSVFDANSLGKWIYDWTVFHFGPATPITEIAGELWLLLIQLAGKIKRAEECRARIRRPSARDLVDDFLDAGERLWQRFSQLLKICEQYMWKAAKRDRRDRKKVVMGMGSGCEFVAAVFGREREMERTEKIMTGMRLWSLRFDANCEEILRNPVGT